MLKHEAKVQEFFDASLLVRKETMRFTLTQRLIKKNVSCAKW